MLDLLRWVARYAACADPHESLFGAPDDRCTAITEARARKGSFDHSQQLIDRSPAVRAELVHLAPSWVHAEGLADAARMGAAVPFAIVTRAGRSFAPTDDQSRFDHVHISFVDADDTFAVTDSFPDGSALVKVSSSLINAGAQLATINWLRRQVVPGKTGSRRAWPQLHAELVTGFSDSFRPSLCVLRYYVIHQRMFGLSAKIALNKQPRALLDAQHLPSMFVYAHELAHHVLRHRERATPAHDAELQADLYAYRLMRRLFGGLYAAEKAQAVGGLALMAIELDEKAQFIRTPTSHPSFGVRWDRLRGQERFSERASPLAAADLLDATRIAPAPRRPLPSAAWRALQEASEWDLTRQEAHYHGMIRAVDGSWAADTSEAELLFINEHFTARGARRLIPGLQLLHSKGPAATLAAWQIRRANVVLDPQRPLAFHSLVELIRNAPVWGKSAAADDLVRRVASLICAQQLLPYLTTAALTKETE